MERLDKFLASQNFGSRKEVTALVKSGAVTVNGEIARDSARKLDPQRDEVAVMGKRVVYQKHIYLMMHKPAGVLSATEDSRQKTVLELLPPELARRGLFPAGRLDKDTTGLLILTDDGEFAHRMLAPKSHVYKLYRAEVERPVTQADIDAFAAGIKSGAQQFAPARLWGEGKIAHVEIREGKFHQVKRMFLAAGNRVLTLKRLKIGGLALDETLPVGGVRPLGEEEIARIFSSNCT